MDVDELAHHANLSQRSLELLARAGTLTTLAGHRRLAHWGAIGVERLPGVLAGTSAREKPLGFAAPNEGEEIVADYRGMGLTLGWHPLALIRGRLNRLKAYPAADLLKLNSGTGTSNLIVWPSVQQTQREAVFGARLMVVKGELQSELGVIHIIADRIRDYSHWLGRIKTGSRDFR